MKLIKTRKKCIDPSCTGEMKFNGHVLTSDPPWYRNYCDKCGVWADFRTTYPVSHTEYEPEEIEERWEK